MEVLLPRKTKTVVLGAQPTGATTGFLMSPKVSKRHSYGMVYEDGGCRLGENSSGHEPKRNMLRLQRGRITELNCFGR